MKGATGVTVGDNGVTTTSIKIGEGSTMNLTEDDKTVTIESMGRPGARIEGIREETSDKDKGEPTKVLTKVMNTAKGKGKKVIAKGAAENPYFIKQGFMPLPSGDAVFYPDQTPGKKAKKSSTGLDEAFSGADTTADLYAKLLRDGVVLAGHAPPELVDPVPVSALRQEILDTMRTWGTQILGDPGKSTTASIRDLQLSIIAALACPPHWSRWLQAPRG